MMFPVRGPPRFGATVNWAFALPTSKVAPDGNVIHGANDTRKYEHCEDVVLVAVTATDPEPPAGRKLADGEPNVNEHVAPGSCWNENVLPATVTVPVRAVAPVFGVTEKSTLPVPFTEVPFSGPSRTVTHGTDELAVHEHEETFAVTSTDSAIKLVPVFAIVLGRFGMNDSKLKLHADAIVNVVEVVPAEGLATATVTLPAVVKRDAGTCTWSPRQNVKGAEIPHAWLSMSVGVSEIPLNVTVVVGRKFSPKIVSRKPGPFTRAAFVSSLLITGFGFVLVIVEVTVLFAGFGSVSVAATLTVLTIVATLRVWTGTLIFAVAPGGIVPRLHVTVFPETEQVPKLVVIGGWHVAKLQYALLTLKLAGSASVKVTLCAIAGPLLLTRLV
jgi:hypothetical protein